MIIFTIKINEIISIVFKKISILYLCFPILVIINSSHSKYGNNSSLINNTAKLVYNMVNKILKGIAVFIPYFKSKYPIFLLKIIYDNV